MTVSGILSHRHLVELIARSPEFLEPGLRVVDTCIATLGTDYLDFIALDEGGRVAIGIARSEPQKVKTGRTQHILTEAVNMYHWVADFREQFIDGAEARLGVNPVRQPPRVLVIAPAFDQQLLDLGAHLLDRVDVEMYTFSAPGENGAPIAFRRSELGDPEAPSAMRKKALYSDHAKKIETQRQEFAEFFDEKTPVRAYAFSSLEDQTARVQESIKDLFKKTVEQILALDADLRPLYRPNRLSFLNRSGEEVAEVTIGPGGGFSLTCKGSKGQGKLQFSPEETDKAVAAVAQAARG